MSEAEIEATLQQGRAIAQANAERAAGQQVGAQIAPATLRVVEHGHRRPVLTEEELKERDRREQARRRAQREAELIRCAAIPARFANASLDDLTMVPEDVRTEYAAAIASVRETTRGPTVVILCGHRGPGKSHIACGLIRDFCRRGHPALYAKAMTYFKALKREYGRPNGDADAAERRFTTPTLLVIDEIHVRSESDWENNCLTDLIDTRYAANRITLLISNQSKEQTAKSLRESIADRIHDGGAVLECLWSPLRGRVPVRTLDGLESDDDGEDRE